MSFFLSFIFVVLISKIKLGCPCLINQFQCGSGACIDIDQRCDDSFDCTDLSDEENCDTVAQCPEGLVLCDNDKRCVHDISQCQSSTLTLLPSSVTTQDSSFYFVTSYSSKESRQETYSLEGFTSSLKKFKMTSHASDDRFTYLSSSQHFRSSNSYTVLASSRESLFSYSKFETTTMLLSFSMELPKEISRLSPSQSSWIMPSASTMNNEIPVSTHWTGMDVSSTPTSSSIAVTQSTPLTSVSTSGKGSTLQDNYDFVPVIIAVSVLLFLLIGGIVAWKLREHIRKKSNTTHFGSMLSLDMVHPYPDENIASRNGQQRKGMVKSSSYNALKEK